MQIFDADAATNTKTSVLTNCRHDSQSALALGELSLHSGRGIVGTAEQETMESAHADSARLPGGW
jgi:hypothetical protein